MTINNFISDVCTRFYTAVFRTIIIGGIHAACCSSHLERDKKNGMGGGVGSNISGRGGVLFAVILAEWSDRATRN